MNYYLHEIHECRSCRREFDPIHIGKSVVGWAFFLRIDKAAGIESLGAWKALFAMPGKVIRDENGNVLTANEMLAVIHNRPKEHGRINLSRAWNAVGREPTYDLVGGVFA